MSGFTLKIYKADGPEYEGTATSLVIPASDGEYGVMAMHENVVVPVSEGELRYTTEAGEVRKCPVSSGLLRVEDNEALVLVEPTDFPDEETRKQYEAEDERDAELKQHSMHAYHQAESELQQNLRGYRGRHSDQVKKV